MAQPERLESALPTESVPLCVDLDGTLIRTDVLWESVVQLWRQPRVALRALRALVLHGKAAFKDVVANAISVDPSLLPYREEVLEFVRDQRARGREVVLATATHRIVAERIAAHLGVFTRVFATEGARNLSAVGKRLALVSSYGTHGFDYIGDHEKDLVVFSASRAAMLVNPSSGLLKKASALGTVTRVFREKRPGAATIVRALRCHQWVKNALLAVPVLVAHRMFDVLAWVDIALSFLAFSWVASAAYVLNDVVDLQTDRLHPQKRLRPLPSGRLSIRGGLALAAGLAATGFAVAAAFLPKLFLGYLVVYLMLTLAYSFDLKRRLLVDVLVLALLYTLRILAGGAAIAVPISEWLLMFSLFMFLSLAFLKRVVELTGRETPGPLAGRGYSSIDLETMRIIGICAGLVSVLVFALYISGPAVSHLYRSPQTLWLICPFLIHWIARIWFLAARGEIHHDPVVFALSDWRSYVTGACVLVIVLQARAGYPTAWW